MQKFGFFGCKENYEIREENPWDLDGGGGVMKNLFADNIAQG